MRLGGLRVREVEQDLGLRFGGDAMADLGGGGAVVGLGSEVLEAVGDGDVADPVSAGDAQAGCPPEPGGLLWPGLGLIRVDA